MVYLLTSKTHKKKAIIHVGINIYNISFSMDPMGKKGCDLIVDKLSLYTENHGWDVFFSQEWTFHPPKKNSEIFSLS